VVRALETEKRLLGDNGRLYQDYLRDYRGNGGKVRGEGRYNLGIILGIIISKLDT